MSKPKVNVIGVNPRNSDIDREYTISSDYVFFEITGSKRNIVNNFTDFDRLALSERERDLLNISVAIYMADISIEKNGFTGERRVDLLIPVADKAFWDGYASTISRICMLLDRNPFKVYFTENKEEVPNDLETPDFKPDVVCCFSGGLDSLTGAHVAQSNGKSTLLSTVIHSWVLASAANSTYEVLKSHYGELDRCVFNASTRNGARAHQFKGMIESSMYCRSFLYLTSAMVVAHHFSAKEVWIPENGIFALNIPLNRGRLGTQTVHPIFIKEMQNLFHYVFPSSPRIINPFEEMTKAEVAAQLNGIPDSIAASVSCAHAWRAPMIAGVLSKPKSRHCGICYPCLARRTSLISAGLKSYDSLYVIDVFKDLFPRASQRKEYKDASVAVLELLKFSHDLRNLGEDDVRSKYPEFEMLPKNYPVKTAVALYKRYADEIVESFISNSSSSMKAAIRDYLS